MATNTRTFHPFFRLPVELRKEIWRLCLPTRTCEVDYPASDIIFVHEDSHEGPYQCKLRKTTQVNSRPPTIAQVCSEGRDVAFEAGQATNLWSPSGIPEDCQWRADLSVPEVWQNSARYAWHLNFDGSYVGRYTSEGDPLGYLAWLATSTGSREASFGLDFLTFRKWQLPRVQDKAEAELAKDVDTLKQLPRWRVVMKTIIIHLPTEQGARTQMFGMLADASVQIVEFTDEARMDAYYNLAQTSESAAKSTTIRQDFRRETQEQAEDRLYGRAMQAYGDEDLAGRLYPAVMFRLCPQMCNHE